MQKCLDPNYKKGEEFSLRVYTASQESLYLIFKNVARLSLLRELTSHVEQNFGEVQSSKFLDDAEQFTLEDIKNGYHEQDCIILKMANMMDALLCKKKMNGLSFYGRKLYVQYDPDREELDDTRIKLDLRFSRVQERIQQLKEQTTNERLKKGVDDSSKYIKQVQDTLAQSEIKKVEQILKQSKSLKQQIYERKQIEKEQSRKNMVIFNKREIRKKHKEHKERKTMKRRIQI